jgi:hypothetical protein
MIPFSRVVQGGAGILQSLGKRRPGTIERATTSSPSALFFL